MTTIRSAGEQADFLATDFSQINSVRALASNAMERAAMVRSTFDQNRRLPRPTDRRSYLMIRRSPARYHSAYGRLADSLHKFDWLANLFLRLSIGFMFFSGAVGKLGDLGKFTAMFNGLGIPGAPVAAPAVAIIELVGGVALMLGLATRAMSLLLALDMVGALLTDIGPGLAEKYASVWSFLSNLFYSSEWLLAGMLLFLVCVGAGSASLDARIDRRLASSERATDSNSL
ncbi:DoxX family protein [Mycobacterium helveticum]|nr:DoxX family protein [Mycobacterium helveticum]